MSRTFKVEHSIASNTSEVKVKAASSWTVVFLSDWRWLANLFFTVSLFFQVDSSFRNLVLRLSFWSAGAKAEKLSKNKARASKHAYALQDEEAFALTITCQVVNLPNMFLELPLDMSKIQGIQRKSMKIQVFQKIRISLRC